jgi:trimeric autotransporter adhesin
MIKPFCFLIVLFSLSSYSYSQTNIVGSRMKEVFKETILHGTEVAVLTDPAPAGNLNNPWEITYGLDSFLWITEAKGYKVQRMNPSTGATTTVLDLSPTASGYLTAGEHTTYNRENWTNPGGVPWPQGGMMGLALHPDFMDAVAPKKYVYIGYIRSQEAVPTDNTGQFYTNFLVRFTYNPGSGKLESPVTICDTLPGSKDHNSGRIIIAPVTAGGTKYLFYASGDMGAGQYENRTRAIKSQTTASYEGKILRFNLEPDGDASTPAANRLNPWIPNSNPFNGATQSAVYTKGVRNNQGFGYDSVKNILYGSEHGPFSDDEINIIESGRNYGHPIVIGYPDGNYNNVKAASSSGSLPYIRDEVDTASDIGASYKGPVYTLYPAPNGPVGTANTIQAIYTSTTGDPGGNNTWHSIAPSGLGLYTSGFIPGWKNSLLLASLKKGKFFRLKLNDAGTGILPTPLGSTAPTNDTVGVFYSQNRFRDIAFSPDGKTIFAAIDKDGTTSGPSAGSPVNSKCPGCIKKYEFLGFADVSGASSISTGIPIDSSTVGTCISATTIVINTNNNNHWVPITGPNGNIIAEIKANGNNLDTVTTSFYINPGTVREDGRRQLYLDRNITIKPKTPPLSAVSIRLYITNREFNNLKAAINSAAAPSGVTTISNLGIFKNSLNTCNTTITGGTASAVPTSVKTTHGLFGYVLTADITSFSSFFFANSGFTTLPTTLLTFTGNLLNKSASLKWTTGSEINTATYVIERSTDGSNFGAIGSVAANGSTTAISYSYMDNDAGDQPTHLLFYRLRMVDMDGSYKYSNSITISLAGIAGRVVLSPNPTTGDTKVSITTAADGMAEWKLTDNAGRIVLQSTVQLRKGNNSITIKAGKLSTGLYYLTVSGAGIDQRVKLQKL